MSLELAFELLRNRLESLSDEVEELRINAADFFPPAPSDRQDEWRMNRGTVRRRRSKRWAKTRWH